MPFNCNKYKEQRLLTTASGHQIWLSTHTFKRQMYAQAFGVGVGAGNLTTGDDCTVQPDKRYFSAEL